LDLSLTTSSAIQSVAGFTVGIYQIPLADTGKHFVITSISRIGVAKKFSTVCLGARLLNVKKQKRKTKMKELTEKQEKFLEGVRKHNKEAVEKIKDSTYITLVASLVKSAMHLSASWLRFLDNEEEFRKKILEDATGRNILKAMAMIAMSNAKEIGSYGGFDEGHIDYAMKHTLTDICISLEEKEREESKEKSEQ
jgi:hypothetical protein